MLSHCNPTAKPSATCIPAVTSNQEYYHTFCWNKGHGGLTPPWKRLSPLKALPPKTSSNFVLTNIYGKHMFFNNNLASILASMTRQVPMLKSMQLSLPILRTNLRVSFSKHTTPTQKTHYIAHNYDCCGAPDPPGIRCGTWRQRPWLICNKTELWNYILRLRKCWWPLLLVVWFDWFIRII